MKSRILKTIGLIAATVLCIGMTAFAAPSPSAGVTVSNTPVKAVDKEGKNVEIQIADNVSADVVADIKSEATLKAVLGESFNKNTTVAAVKEVTAIGEVVFPVTITFKMNGVTKDSVVQILHYNGSAWEKIATTVANGTVTGTFDSLSPVAFVVDKTTVGATTSPTTSAATVSSAAVLGLVAAAGAFGLKKKEY